MQTDSRLPSAPPGSAPLGGSARPCPECGRETKQVGECLVCQSERIMRAAPDLLAALKEVTEWYAGESPNSEAWERARVAIAKAQNAALCRDSGNERGAQKPD